MHNGQKYSARRKPVLLDHQRIGKRLIPPLMKEINYQEISWGKQLIPELIWLALILNNRYGYMKGAELALAPPEVSRRSYQKSPKGNMVRDPKCLYSIVDRGKKENG